MSEYEDSNAVHWLGMELGTATGWDGYMDCLTFYDVVPSDLGVRFLFGVSRDKLVPEMQQLISEPFTLNIDIVQGKIEICAAGNEESTYLTSVDWSVAGYTGTESPS